MARLIGASALILWREKGVGVPYLNATTSGSLDREEARRDDFVGGAMTTRRKFGSAAAIGGSIAAIALLAASSVARADELADLRANQELLQKRIDQLSQAPP